MIQAKTYICKEKDGSYSLFTDDDRLNYGITGEGRSVSAAIDDWMATYEAMKQGYADKGLDFVEAEFRFVYDLPSFLSYYGGLLTFKGLAKFTGVSAAQLSQYATGYRNPSPKTVAKIEAGIHNLSQELGRVQLI